MRRRVKAAVCCIAVVLFVLSNLPLASAQKASTESVVVTNTGANPVPVAGGVKADVSGNVDSTITNPVPVEAPDIAMLSSPGQAELNRTHLLSSFYRCAVELSVQARKMPRIVVLRIGSREARVADIHNWGFVYVEQHPNTHQVVYMAWVVGEPGEGELANLFLTILSDHFHLGLSETEMKMRVTHVVKQSQATVSVKSLLESNR